MKLEDFFNSLDFHTKEYYKLYDLGDMSRFNRYIIRLDKIEKWRKQNGKMYKRRKL